MANKHKKRCSTLYIIKEMKIKTRYHYTPIRMAKICIWNTGNIKCWQRCEATGILIHCWWACKIIQPLWKTVWPFLTILNILLPCNPAILLFGIYSKSWKFMSSQEPAALFTAAKTWKQSKCPFRRQTDKLCYIQTIEYHLALNRNELLNHKRTS